MGRFTYYSPLLIGAGLVLVMQDTLRESPPESLGRWPWLYVALLALGAALVCQLLLIGAQGAFAQVLPGPGGRTIRGGTAMLSGAALLGAAGLLPAAAMLFSEGISTGGWGAVGCAVVLGVVSAIAYMWGWPTADRDFAETQAE